MVRPTTDEIRDVKNKVWDQLDKTKNKQLRENLANQILILQWVLDERP
jgi:hypothetical protein